MLKDSGRFQLWLWKLKQCKQGDCEVGPSYVKDPGQVDENVCGALCPFLWSSSIMLALGGIGLCGDALERAVPVVLTCNENTVCNLSGSPAD